MWNCRLQVKKIADSLHLDNSPQFDDEWYQFLCEVCDTDLFFDFVFCCLSYCYKVYVAVMIGCGLLC